MNSVAITVAMVSAIAAILVAVITRAQTRETERRRAETAERLATLERRYARLERLETETGPLRLYMYLCARASVRWLLTYSNAWKDENGWQVLRAIPKARKEHGYHTAGPMIYRLLRPLTVGGLIVHRMHDADLALDEPMVEIVRFHNAAYEMLTREEIMKPFKESPEYCFESAWSATDPNAGPRPFQRIRDSYLRWAADALSIKEEGDKDRRCMSHSEFLERWEHPKRYREFHGELEPVTSVIDQFDPRDNPFFWFRLVGYAYACTWYLHEIATRARSEKIIYNDRYPLAVEELLETAKHPELFERPTDGFREEFKGIIRDAL
jgi:hypothetical protein